jgi:hypothetical protein
MKARRALASLVAIGTLGVPGVVVLAAAPAAAAQGLCNAGDALVGHVTSPSGDPVGDLCLGDDGLYLVLV